VLKELMRYTALKGGFGYQARAAFTRPISRNIPSGIPESLEISQ